MMYPVNQQPAGGLKSLRRWAGDVFAMLIEARREETKRALARVAWIQCDPAMGAACAGTAVAYRTLTYPAVERRGPNRATNVTRLHTKRGEARAEEPQTKVAVAGGGRSQ